MLKMVRGRADHVRAMDPFIWPGLELEQNFSSETYPGLPAVPLQRSDLRFL